jgi:hypothetical protein
VLFYEYFHGDTGRGVGAAHQTGWTGLVAKLLMPRYACELRVSESAPRPECDAEPTEGLPRQTESATIPSPAHLTS